MAAFANCLTADWQTPYTLRILYFCVFFFASTHLWGEFIFIQNYTCSKMTEIKRVCNIYVILSCYIFYCGRVDFWNSGDNEKTIITQKGSNWTITCIFHCLLYRLISSIPRLGNSTVLSEQQEAFILIHSLRDANLPKFLAEDVPLFESIMADLFPGISPPARDSGALEVSLIEMS